MGNIVNKIIGNTTILSTVITVIIIVIGIIIYFIIKSARDRRYNKRIAAASKNTYKSSAEEEKCNDLSAFADLHGRVKNFAILDKVSSEQAIKHENYLKLTPAEIRLKRANASTKNIQEFNQVEIFAKLRMIDTKVDVSKTGAWTVTTTIFTPDKLTIYDGLPAAIDGSIDADLYENGSIVATAPIVFPLDGVDETRQKLQGMCLRGAEVGKQYEVKFRPRDLWAIEK